MYSVDLTSLDSDKKKINNEEFRCKKPPSAGWNFLLKLAFISGSYIYIQLFHFNCIENDIYIAIRVKLLNLNIGAW